MSPADAIGRERSTSLIERVESLRRSRPDQAWEVLSRGFAGALRGAAPERRGELWRLRGHVLRSLSRLGPAAAAYHRAQRWYERAGDQHELGRCAIGLVDALMYLGRYDEARAVAARGRRALSRTGDRTAEARLLNNEGNLHHRLDRPLVALQRYRQARAILARSGDRRAARVVEGNIANCLSLLGRTAEARRLYHGARRASQAAGRSVDALNADYSLAYLDFLEHRHERALEGLERVRAQAGAHAPSTAALASLDRAEILLRLGDHEAARDEAASAAGAFRALGMGYERAKAETFLALADYRLGRPAAAGEWLERSIAAFVQEGNAVWTGEALVGLAASWWNRGSPATATPLLAAAARRFARAGDHEREGCALALLARARVESGRSGAAAPLARARSLARGRASARLRYLTRVAAAVLARSRGDRASARRHLTRAARESERLAAHILDEQWRASFWGDWGWPHQELASLEMEAGRPEAAFEALERGRGRALASPWRRSRRAAPPRSVRAWAAAQQARDRDRRSGLLAIPTPGDAARVASRALARPAARAVPARAILDGMAGGSALLDYAILDGSLSAFVGRRDGLALVPRLAAEAEVRSLVHDVLFELRRASLEPEAGRVATSGPSDVLTELASLVLWPLLEGTGGPPEVLAIVPAGPLGRIPWAALPLPDRRPLCAASQLVVVPGLRLGIRERERGGRRGAPLVVGVADEGLGRVPAELEAVATALPGAIVLAGPEATAERFLAQAPGASWVHFAGHGVFESGRSGLRLHDRWILAEELDALELRARGVALSACQTARALVRPGEEWFGLPRNLLLAGAGAVLAAQWDVGDAAAARFMSGVYGRLERGATLGEAVATTQGEHASQGWHPLDWAGFVVLGGPRSVAALSRETA